MFLNHPTGALSTLPTLQVQGALLKKIVESIKDLVTDANLECGADGMTMQAMDSSHVSLIFLNLQKNGFEDFRCDRNVNLGLNLVSTWYCLAIGVCRLVYRCRRLLRRLCSRIWQRSSSARAAMTPSPCGPKTRETLWRSSLKTRVRFCAMLRPSSASYPIGQGRRSSSSPPPPCPRTALSAVFCRRRERV